MYAFSAVTRAEGTVASPGEIERVDAARAREYVLAARLVAVRIAPYFATALLRMRERANLSVATLGVDRYWRLYWNPEYVMSVASRPDGVSLLAGVWLHEVGHLVRDHPGRFEALGQPPERHVLFNVAGDALINGDLAVMGVALPDRPVRLADIPGATADMTAEEIYALLGGLDTDRRQAGRGPAGVVLPDCGSAAGGPDREYEDPSHDDRIGPAQAEMARRAVAAEIREHARRHGVGSVPGSWQRWADGLLDPVVDWRSELRTLLRRDSSRATGRRDLAFTRPSRRQPPGVVLPAAVDAAPLRVACVVDTSGSIGAEELGQALAEVAALARHVTDPAIGLTVIPCDTGPGTPVRLRDPRRVREIPLTGGGGTDMGAGIHAAARLRPRPDTVVVLTDGYTPWPSSPPPEYPAIHCIAVLWHDHPPLDTVPDWIRALSAPPTTTLRK